MEEQEKYDNMVEYTKAINNYAMGVVQLRHVGDDESNYRAMLHRNTIKNLLDLFKEIVDGEPELQNQIKKYELFLIGSEN